MNHQTGFLVTRQGLKALTDAYVSYTLRKKLQRQIYVVRAWTATAGAFLTFPVDEVKAAFYPQHSPALIHLALSHYFTSAKLFYYFF